MKPWKEEYKKLNIIDKIRFHWRVRQEEKLEDKRQSMENDDRLPIDKMKIARELNAERENRRNKVKALDSAEQPIYIEPENRFDARYKLEGDSPTLFPKGTLDYALDQYLSATLYYAEEGKPCSSYRVLTDLGGMSNGMPGNNKENEDKLINSLNNRNGISLNRQINKQTKNTAFYHINKGQIRNPNTRLYLNCKRENIALLAANLMKNMDDMDHYYFKFNSDWQAENKSRSEQFVFYIDDDKQLNDIMQRIEKTKQQNPKLFEGDENINPFLKTINGVAYANEPQRIGESDKTTYVDLNGRRKSITANYNNLLASALDDSFSMGIGNVISSNPEMVENLPMQQVSNPSLNFVMVLSSILEDGPKKMKLIESMKNSLVELSKRNPTLEIQGIDEAKQQQQQKQERTTEASYEKV